MPNTLESVSFEFVGVELEGWNEGNVPVDRWRDDNRLNPIIKRA